MTEEFRTYMRPWLVSVLVLRPQFRLFCPAVKQGIYAVHMLWVNIAQNTDMLSKSRPICHQFAYFKRSLKHCEHLMELAQGWSRSVNQSKIWLRQKGNSCTRCCHQLAHIFFLRRHYCIADVSSTQDYADEVRAKLYSENCFVSCSCRKKEAPLDHLCPIFYPRN